MYKYIHTHIRVRERDYATVYDVGGQQKALRVVHQLLCGNLGWARRQNRGIRENESERASQ